jgi:pyrimidine operon attenuation protein/uracil phosphoribosyltransferase
MAETLPRILLDEAATRRVLERMAYEIIEKNGGSEGLVLVGVVRKGDILAGRLRDIIERIEGVKVPVGRLDITLYRDDLGGPGPLPTVRKTEIPFDVSGMTLVLVDDVLYTGRTTRAALDALTDFGRPTAIRFAVLVDRGHRELPIQPDFVGHLIETRHDERVNVVLREDGNGQDAVWLLESGDDWVPGED